MALAILKLLDVSPNEVHFEADIGTNTHYRYSIGSGRMTRDGFELLEGVTYESPIQEQKNNFLFQAGFQFTVPTAQFSRQQRFIQLSSFKGRDGKSSAWSKVLEVRTPLSPSSLPEQAIPMTISTLSTSHSTFEPCRSVSQSFVENRLSSAMFWNQLFDIARLLTPAGSQLISQVVNQRTEGNVNPTDVERLLTSLLQVIGSTQTPATTAPARGITSSAETPHIARSVSITTLPGTTFAPYGPRAMSYRALRQRATSGFRNGRYSQGQDFGAISGPALVGLITTLGPSVLQALKPLLENSPQLLQTFVDSPLRLLNAISEINRQEQQLTQQQINNMLNKGNQALLYTLLRNQLNQRQNGEALPSTPIVPTTGVPLTTTNSRYQPLLSAVRVQLSTPKVDSRINPRLISPEPITITGKPRALYGDESIQLRLILEAEKPPDRPIPQVVAHLKIKSPNRGELLFEHRYPLQNVLLNQTTILTLKKSDVQQLPKGIDLLVSVDVTWRNLQQQVYTTPIRATQTLQLIGSYGLKSVGGRLNQPKNLKDPSQFRAFWHRIWEGGSALHRRWKLSVMACYYYRLQPHEVSNGLMETKLNPAEEGANESKSKIRWGGLMTSGLELAPSELNKLLPLVFDQLAWTEKELEAIATESFGRYVDQQATTELSLRGRSDERGSIWVFPVMDLTMVELYQVSALGMYGEVTETISVSKTFPVPIAAVFVGMENES